jgi:hypothetical protein
MERTMISWNLPNWITVVLMAAAGYAVLGAVRQVMLHSGGGMPSGPAPSLGGY